MNKIRKYKTHFFKLFLCLKRLVDADAGFGCHPSPSVDCDSSAFLCFYLFVGIFLSSGFLLPLLRIAVLCCIRRFCLFLFLLLYLFVWAVCGAQFLYQHRPISIDRILRSSSGIFPLRLISSNCCHCYLIIWSDALLFAKLQINPRFNFNI